MFSKIEDREALISLLEQAGAVFDGYKCTCPFHNDRNPSAGIFESGGHWRFRCFTCRLTLDYYDIIAKRENLDIADTLRMEPPEEKVRDVFPTLDEAIGHNPVSIHQYTDSEGNLLVVKARYGATTKRRKSYGMVSPYYGGFVRECPRPPYPLYAIPTIEKAKNVVLVEGEKCADALNELGIPATTCLGSSMAKDTDWTPLHGKRVVIWPDNDQPGRDYATDAEQALLPFCTVSLVEPGGLGLAEKEDVVDYMERGHGKEDIRQVLNNACKETPAAGVREYIEGMISGEIRAVEWPWPLLHRYTQALLPGAITVICGTGGCSKSFMLTEALAFWLERGERVALYALEENKTFHLLRALAQQTGLSNLTRCDWVRAHPDEVRQAWEKNKKFLDNTGKHLYALPTRQQTQAEMLHWIKDQCRAGCRVIAIDPITAAGRGKNIWEADEQFVLAAKKVADKYQVSLVFVTHPKKDDSTPHLNNLRGGAAYQQFVQNVFWLERVQLRYCELEDGERCRINRRIHILKARNAEEMQSGILAYSLTKGLKLHEYGEFKQFLD